MILDVFLGVFSCHRGHLAVVLVFRLRLVVDLSFDDVLGTSDASSQDGLG